MPVLHVVDGVVHRLPLHGLDVEVHRVIGREHQQVEPRGVGAHLVDQLVERDEVAGALAHRHGLAVAQERHPLVDHHLGAFGVVAQRLGGAPHAHDVAVVIGAPDVHEAVEPSLELVDHVRAVGGEVRGLPVRADHHAILVVAELGRAEPGGALGVVDVAALAKPLDRRGDGAGLLERMLGRPRVERHAEPVERRADAVQRPARALLAQPDEPVVGFEVGERRTVLARRCPRA